MYFVSSTTIIYNDVIYYCHIIYFYGLCLKKEYRQYISKKEDIVDYAVIIIDIKNVR